jgi:hypothetical protein
MRIQEIINEIAQGSEINLFHGTLLKNLPSIQEDGLNGKYTKVRPGLIHLSNDPLQASEYFNNFGDGDGLLLSLSSGNLDQSKLGPDREDLMDLLGQRRSRKNWRDFTWRQSIRICGQCIYDGTVQPQLLTVVGYESNGNFIIVKRNLIDFM